MNKPPIDTQPSATAKTATAAKLLDAAKYCYQQLGAANTTMEDIALQANISRRTIYRYYANQQLILAAVVEREALQFLDKMQQQLSDIDSLGDYIVEALIFTLQHGPRTRSHRFLFSQNMLPQINQLYLGSARFFEQGNQLFRGPYLRARARGQVGEEVELTMITEWFNRLAVSYLSTPSPHYQNRQQLRKLFKAMLLPILHSR